MVTTEPDWLSGKRYSDWTIAFGGMSEFGGGGVLPVLLNLYTMDHVPLVPLVVAQEVQEEAVELLPPRLC